jgi:3-hydroxy-D-aspartate aldolase
LSTGFYLWTFDHFADSLFAIGAARLPAGRISTRMTSVGIEALKAVRRAAGNGTKPLRAEVATPALILDLDLLDVNIARMARHAAVSGVGLRPHAKAHKCPAIARRLVSAGALGASCATIAEAEAMADGGIGGLLLTSPIAGKAQAERLRAVLSKGADLMVVTDDPDNLDMLAATARSAGRVLRIVVELDVGQRRTGCSSPEDAVALAGSASRTEGLAFAGLQAYWGHLQQAAPFTDRKARVEDQAAVVAQAVTLLREADLSPPIVTGGGTGTSFIDPHLGLFTELQPGSYLFMDSCYRTAAIDGEGAVFETSLFVAASVVSAVRRGRAVVNAGLKAFATDSGRPVPARGAPPGATYAFMGDEHGAIDFEPPKFGPGATRGRVGDTVELVTSHCDPTVNLHSRYVVVRGDEVVDFWPIEGRY